MSEYTKGPWVWRGKDGGIYQEGTTHRFGPRVMVPTYEYDSGLDIDVSDADARLISAAPDMLEALPDLSCVINWLENGCDVSEAVKELRIYKARIDAAIEKAKGQ